MVALLLCFFKQFSRSDAKPKLPFMKSSGFSGRFTPARLNTKSALRQYSSSSAGVESKSIDKEIARIEAKKVKAETKAAESAKKAEAEDVLKKLLASGVSADDILAKLK